MPCGGRGGGCLPTSGENGFVAERENGGKGGGIDGGGSGDREAIDVAEVSECT